MASHETGGWNAVNAIALRLLADAEAADVGPDNVRDHACAPVAGEHLDA